MLLSKSVEIRQSETASRPAIRRSRICIFYTASMDRRNDKAETPEKWIETPGTGLRAAEGVQAFAMIVFGITVAHARALSKAR
jgi:hypothetical protein